MNLQFTPSANGQQEAVFTAGACTLLQLKYDEVPGKSNSLAVMSRLDSSMEFTTAKLYVPAPTRVVSLPVHMGEQVKLVTEVAVRSCQVLITNGTSGSITPDDVAALIEQVEQNRLAIEGQARLNDKQQLQIDENKRVNEDQEERIIDGTDIAPKERVEDLFK